MQHWEPAEWIAKLCDFKTDDNHLPMRCNRDVGHGDVSGRYERYKEVVLEYVFLYEMMF